MHRDSCAPTSLLNHLCLSLARKNKGHVPQPRWRPSWVPLDHQDLKFFCTPVCTPISKSPHCPPSHPYCRNSSLLCCARSPRLDSNATSSDVSSTLGNTVPSIPISASASAFARHPLGWSVWRRQLYNSLFPSPLVHSCSLAVFPTEQIC